MVDVRESALPPALFRRARQAIRRLGTERLRQSYFTTFWMPLGGGRPKGKAAVLAVPAAGLDARPAHALEEAVLALARIARPRGCTGAEWWLGRSFTTDVPIEFHFDHDVKRRERGGPLVHPALSSVLFFNRVRGGELAVVGERGTAKVKPRANRYATFAGHLAHGVLDARGRVPSGRLPGPRGRMRVTLVVNFWRRRPTGVPTWRASGVYRALQPG